MSATTGSETVLLERRGPVAWLRLNRPGQLNALNGEMQCRLGEVLTEIEQDRTSRVIVLTGAGRAFCTGGDLAEFRTQILAGEREPLADAVASAGAVFRRFETSPLPVIAAVNGVAVAGGLELMMCCDLVVAARSAKIGDGHLRFGVLPGGGGSVRLPRRVPANVAKWLLMTGDLLPAERFVPWGLVNAVIEPEHLEATVTELSERIAGLSPLGLARTKQLANTTPDLALDDALSEELGVFRSYIDSSDFMEGLNAFSEKRVPRYDGR